jgi:aminopeptidase N
MKPFCLFVLLLQIASLAAQPNFYKKIKMKEEEIMRGKNSILRTSFDVTYYQLDLHVDMDKHTIEGACSMAYKCLKNSKQIQLDLFQNLKVDSIIDTKNRKSVTFEQKDQTLFVNQTIVANAPNGNLKIYYQGKPNTARNAPWDGGFVWKQTTSKQNWLGVACQGLGARVWWPCKDQSYDEPDSVKVNVSCSDTTLTCVANGVLKGISYKNKRKIFNWSVSNPINTYCVTLNIAPYTHYYDYYTAADGSKLKCNYWVLPENLEKAKIQFKQVHEVLRVNEKYLDKYPFWNDQYSIVETDYLGMEHQGAVAYGNKYMNGYLGMQPPGVDFDFIIIHESGHEWFGNSISAYDNAELWIHESFTTYLESVYVEEHYGYKKAVEYINFFKNNVANKMPMIGPMDVAYNDHDVDIYYKGALMLNTLRHSIDNDSLWWQLFKGFYKQHCRQIIKGKDYETTVQKFTNYDYSGFLNQYLNYAKIPTLELRLRNETLEFRWSSADAPNLKFPMHLTIQGKKSKITPTSQWQKLATKANKDEIVLPQDLFYIDTKWL